MDSSITNIYEKFYILYIQNLALNFIYGHVFGINHYGKTQYEEFQLRGSFKYDKCIHDYSERLVAIFVNQIYN